MSLCLLDLHCVVTVASNSVTCDEAETREAKGRKRDEEKGGQDEEEESAGKEIESEGAGEIESGAGPRGERRGEESRKAGGAR